jgi:hypothetical protein
MTQADRVLSTPPTNTSAIDHPMMFPPVDPTRRRFLTVAAVASVAGASSLAAAAMAPSLAVPAVPARSGVCADRRQTGGGHTSNVLKASIRHKHHPPVACPP